MAEFEARLEELLANPPAPAPAPPSSLSSELSALAALANSPQLLKSHPILCALRASAALTRAHHIHMSSARDS